MARFFRSLFRGIFGVEALAILYVLGNDLFFKRRADDTHILTSPWSYAVGLLAFLLLVAAFWTTRKPRPRRNYIAAAACLLNSGAAVLFLDIDLSHSALGRRVLLVNGLLLTLGLAGIMLFLRRETVPAAAILPPARLAQIPGDRTWRGTGSIVTLVFVAAAFVMAHIWDKWAQVHGLPRTSDSILSVVLFLTLALTVTAAIHESGHALAGAAFGMKLLAFTIGPFQWSQRGGRWRFKFKKQVFGGSVSSAPTHLDQPAWQDVFMVFSGPLANLCSAPAFFWIALHCPGTRLQPFWFLLTFLATLSIVVPVLNLFPFRTATGSYSDGARILQMFTHSPVLEYQRALRALQSTLATPLRARDLDPAVFQRAAALRPRELAGLHAHLIAAHIFEEQGRIPEAAAEIAAADAIYAACTIKLSAPLHTAFVIFHALHNRNATAARLWWDRISAKIIDRKTVDYRLATASLAYIEGRRAEAQASWQSASDEARTLPDCGGYDTDRNRVALLRTLLNQQSAQPAPTTVENTAAQSVTADGPSPQNQSALSL